LSFTEIGNIYNCRCKEHTFSNVKLTVLCSTDTCQTSGNISFMIIIVHALRLILIFDEARSVPAQLTAWKDLSLK